MSTVILILAVAFVLSWIPILVVYFRDRRRDSGERVITCPETRTAEVVRVDAGHAAWTDLVGDKKLRLQSCSRWPEKADCGQDCLAQVESAPDGCLVRERLTAWYQDAKCVLCGMPIGPVRWIDNRPGLRSSDERVLFWEDVPARDLDRTLETSKPICSDCVLAESFRSKFPDRVVDDPWHTVDRKKVRAAGPTA
jgi:hypothetical protein